MLCDSVCLISRCISLSTHKQGTLNQVIVSLGTFRSPSVKLSNYSTPANPSVVFKWSYCQDVDKILQLCPCCHFSSHHVEIGSHVESFHIAFGGGAEGGGGKEAHRLCQASPLLPPADPTYNSNHHSGDKDHKTAVHKEPFDQREYGWKPI